MRAGIFAVEVLVVIVTLAGCSSVSDVTPVGKDTYMVGSQVRGGLTSWAEVKSLALQRAASYCGGLGKHMAIVDTETHGARGWTPQEAEITFRCLDEDDPEYQRPEATK